MQSPALRPTAWGPRCVCVQRTEAEHRAGGTEGPRSHGTVLIVSVCLTGRWKEVGRAGGGLSRAGPPPAPFPWLPKPGAQETVRPASAKASAQGEPSSLSREGFPVERQELPVSTRGVRRLPGTGGEAACPETLWCLASLPRLRPCPGKTLTAVRIATDGLQD